MKNSLATPFLGERGRAACQQLGKRLARKSAERDDLIAAFGALFERTWRDLGLMVGAQGVSAVLQRAQRLTRLRHPLIELVKIDDHAVHLEGLHGCESTLAAIRDALTEVFVTSMEIMASLIGYDLVAPLVQGIEAELQSKGLI